MIRNIPVPVRPTPAATFPAGPGPRGRARRTASLRAPAPRTAIPPAVHPKTASPAAPPPPPLPVLPDGLCIRPRRRRRSRLPQPHPPRRGSAGFTLADLLLVLAILGIVVLISVPPLLRTTAELRLRMAASEASHIFALARSYAVRHNAHVAVKFHPPGEARGAGGPPGAPGGDAGRTWWTLHRDGDGDGVRSRDVARGIDPPVPAPGAGIRRQARFAQGIVPGFPPGPLPRDPSGRRLQRRHDPIRFNRSDMASFGPLGTATPGSLYLTDGRNLAVVRITGRTARTRVLLYRADEGRWR